MPSAVKIAFSIVVLSVAASVFASWLHASTAAWWLGAPALVLSGLAALGHLVTLDDDSPGGWSNPENSRAIWHRSLAELAAKICVFAIVLLLIVVFPR